MKTKAIRLYGANDLRFEEFALPEIKENEILLRVVTDSLCTSTYKAVIQGTKHKRVPPDVATKPIIIGHEMCGDIIKVGAKLTNQWQVGQRVVIQPALKLETGYDPGYSYPYIGGNSTYAIVPEIVLEKGCLLPFNGDSYFSGSLVEGLGCILRGYKGFYHTDYTNYQRFDGPKENGRIAILGGAGPMGIGAVEIALGDTSLKQIIVTDINGKRLQEAKMKCPPSLAKKKGVDLRYIDTSQLDDVVKELLEISEGGFDDVFVMVPVPDLFSMAEKIARFDGCINFYAGPAVHDLQGSLNLYRIHYDGIHVLGTAGSIPQDTIDTIKLIEANKIRPGALVSHILGLKAVPEAIMAMAHPSGAKKVCYNHLDIPLVALSDFEELGKKDPLYYELDEIIKRNGGLWCKEAEDYLLAHAPKL